MDIVCDICRGIIKEEDKCKNCVGIVCRSCFPEVSYEPCGKCGRYMGDNRICDYIERECGGSDPICEDCVEKKDYREWHRKYYSAR